ncbi:hypothetical protein STEG23_037018, partial [Scotinomys teguina]
MSEEQQTATEVCQPTRRKSLMGWKPLSSAFCMAGFVDMYCLNLVLSCNVLFIPSMVGKIFFNDFVEYVFCAFELVFFSFFYPYYSKPVPGNNPDVPQLKNGLRKCGTYTQWSITPQRKAIIKFAGKWKELENIILSEVTQTQKDKRAFFKGFIHFLFKGLYHHHKIGFKSPDLFCELKVCVTMLGCDFDHVDFNLPCDQIK